MPTGVLGSAIVVERADRALVVRSTDAETGALGFAAALPPEPSRTTVVVDASAAGALHALDDRLLDQLKSRLYADAPPGWGMRLVAARAGRPDPSGAPPLAARLADRLGVGVVAPDGELIALRGGELFSAGPGAGWLGFRRGGHPEWTGPRYPAPSWQAALPREFRSAKPRPFSRFRPRDRRASSGPVTVTAIPAGLWVRGAGTAPLPLVDLGFGVPVEPARPIVLVGAPGERVPGVTELVAFFEELPPVVRENAVLVPYGQDPQTCAVLAQGLADRFDTAVRAYHALPHYATDGTRRFAVFNTAGVPERLTQTPESVYAPTGAAVPAPYPGVHERTLMPAPAVGEPPASRFSAVRPDDDDAADDFADVDPVVFEASMDTPAQPIAPLDGSAFAAPAEETTGPGAVVTVDADGFMRPAGRWPISPVTRPGDGAAEAVAPDTASGAFMAEAGSPAFAAEGPLEPAFTEARTGVAAATRPTPQAASMDTRPDAASGFAATAAGPARSAAGPRPAAGRASAPSAFQTTASTVFPQIRSAAARAVPAGGRSADPGTPLATRPDTGAPHSSTEPAGRASREVRAETPSDTPEQVLATPDRVVWDPREHGSRPAGGGSLAERPAEPEENGARPAGDGSARHDAQRTPPAADTAPDGIPARQGGARSPAASPAAPPAGAATENGTSPASRTTPPETRRPDATGAVPPSTGSPALPTLEPAQPAETRTPENADRVLWAPPSPEDAPQGESGVDSGSRRSPESEGGSPESSQGRGGVDSGSWPSLSGAPQEGSGGGSWSSPVSEGSSEGGPQESSQGRGGVDSGSWPSLSGSPQEGSGAESGGGAGSWSSPVSEGSSEGGPQESSQGRGGVDSGTWPSLSGSPQEDSGAESGGGEDPDSWQPPVPGRPSEGGQQQAPQGRGGADPGSRPSPSGVPQDGPRAAAPRSGDVRVAGSGDPGAWPSPVPGDPSQGGAGGAGPQPGDVPWSDPQGGARGADPRSGGSWGPPEPGRPAESWTPEGTDAGSSAHRGGSRVAASQPGEVRAQEGPPRTAGSWSPPVLEPAQHAEARVPENADRASWAPPPAEGEAGVAAPRAGEGRAASGSWAPPVLEPGGPGGRPGSTDPGSWASPPPAGAPRRGAQDVASQSGGSWAPPVPETGRRGGPPRNVHPGSWPSPPGSPPQDAAPRPTGSWAPPSLPGQAGPATGFAESSPATGGPASAPQGRLLVPAGTGPRIEAQAVPRRDYDRLWLADRMSTPQERQAFRASLGWRYDAAVRSVARLLAEHPGLRGAQTDETLMTELAAVRVFVARAEAELVEAIRAGGDERDGALAVCAAAGLRRLPSLQGVVVRGGPADASAADAYRPGQDLIEAAPLIALDDIDAPVAGKVEILIWSATARRLNGFVEERKTPEVVFLPGTVFRVLAVDPPFAPGAPGARRVLLTEVPPTKAGPGHESWSARVTARLEEAAANRAAPPGEADETDDRFAPLPGDPARSMP